MTDTTPQKPAGLDADTFAFLQLMNAKANQPKQEENSIKPAPDPQKILNERSLKRAHESWDSFKTAKEHYDAANKAMSELEQKYGITEGMSREDIQALHDEHPELGQALKRLEKAGTIFIQRIDSLDAALKDARSKNLDISDIDHEIAEMKKPAPKQEQENTNDDFGFNRGYDDLPQSVQLSSPQQQGVLRTIAHAIGRLFQAVGRALGITHESPEKAAKQPEMRQSGHSRDLGD